MEGSTIGLASPIDMTTERPLWRPGGAAWGRVGRRRRAALPTIALLLAALLFAAALLAVSLELASSPGAISHPRTSARGAANPIRGGLALLPETALGTVSSTVGAGDPVYAARALSAGRFRVHGAAMSATFASAGVAVSAGGSRLELGLRRVSLGGTEAAVGSVAPRARANEVSYSYPSLRAWYRNGPAGLEQGFTLGRPRLDGRVLAGSSLALSFELSTNAAASVSRDGQSVTFTHAASPAMRLGSLLAVDARGRVLPSGFSLRGGELRLRVDTAGARYPIKIDPLLQSGAVLEPTDESGTGEVGMSVAISADGTTALVGAPRDNNFAGAAWVFARSGSAWSQQGPKLVSGGAADHTGCVEEPELNGLEESVCGFGASVALSADGNTAIVGSPRDNELKGGAWVFTRSGTAWSREPQELTGAGEADEGHFGKSIAISADGSLALIAAPSDNKGRGAVWAFERTGSGWALMGGGKLVSGEEIGTGYFGRGVALSGDGSTALIGAPGDDNYVGDAWLYTRSGSTWTKQAKLTGEEEHGFARFGFAVALSEGGGVALIGGPHDYGEVGAVWIFARSGSTLVEEGPKLTGPGETGEGQFGRTVAISSSGESALVGGPHDGNGFGAAWVLTRTPQGWSSDKFSALSARGQFAASVAISADGNVPLFGMPLANRKVGVAWAGLPPAVINAVEPSQGPAAGGTTVAITGAGFTDVSGVSFGGVPASYEVLSSASIVAVSPPGAGGRTVNVSITTARGTSETSPADRFTYLAPEGGSPGGGSPGGGSPGGSDPPLAGAGSESSALAFAAAAGGGCRLALVSRKVAVLRRGRATPRLRRIGSGRCAGKLTLRVRVRTAHGRYVRRSIGVARFALSTSRAVTVRVRLNAFGRSLLRSGHGQVHASLVLLKLTPLPARAQTASVRLRLRR